jgi:subtilisin family serine protease
VAGEDRSCPHVAFIQRRRLNLAVSGRYLLLILAVCLVLGQPLGALAATSAPTPSTSNSTATGVLVRFQPATLADGNLSASDLQLLASAGAGDILESLGTPGAYRVAVRSGYTPAGVAAALGLLPQVVYAEPDRAISLDDAVASYQATSNTGVRDWDLSAIEAQQSWQLGSGQGVVVAVLDTGVSATHPDLAGRLLSGWNFISNSQNTADDAGHGTFVAGLIAGGQTASGESGVAPGASILPVKILDSSGTGSTASFVAGIDYAVQAGARIINISASGTTDSPALEDALSNAEAHGVLVVASAGNNANEAPLYPASAPTVLAVSATDPGNALASFSSFGPYVDVAAPGVDITSSWWSAAQGNSYVTASGSSASAPLVAGVAAIVAGLRPDLSPAQLREIVMESAKDIGSPGIDAQTGYGLVDAYAAARIAKVPDAPQAAALSTVESNDGWHLRLAASGFAPNEPLMVWTDSGAGYRVIRNLSADSTGAIVTDIGPEWRFPEGSLAAYAVGLTSGHATIAQLKIDPAPVADPFKPVPGEVSTVDRLYFPQTGHSLAFGFKQFWESHGGLAVFGYPISEEFSEKNPDTGQTYTVQYFERNRFEYHPELAGTPLEVSLGRLGVQTAPQVYPISPPVNASGVLSFDATHHTLSGPFRQFWEAHGGLALFGYPTSEPFEEGGMLVQYFERSRLEYHPELPADSQVLLTRLGSDLARENGYLH